MKCIYCNSERDLTVSDIIPAALTGAKLRKRFVCKAHNSFTNDHYEKKMIEQLAVYRNLLGLTERDGDPVRYKAKIEVDGYTAEEKIVSDLTSIMKPKKPFRTKDERGRTVLIGETDQLRQINGVKEDEIVTINMAKVEVSRVDDLRELLISTEVLHAIAKIGYEWHCNNHGVEEYKPEKYKEIVEYILSPDNDKPLVNIVICPYTYTLLDSNTRTGSNMAFEYDDDDGYTYVIFSLFSVVIYKVRICRHGNNSLSCANMNRAFFYHVDGTTDQVVFATFGQNVIASEAPNVALKRLCSDIKLRFSKLGERDLSRAYIANNLEKIKKLLPKYKDGKLTLAELMDFEAQDRVIPVYILEQIYCHQTEYDKDDTFRNNMVKILKTDEQFAFTRELRTEALRRYVEMDQKGEFAEMFENAIAFFESECQ